MNCLHRSIVFGILLTISCGAWAGEIVHRIVANVNGHAILLSDWQEELNLGAFLNARSAVSFTAAERKAALDRLIDRELLREQLRPSDPASADAVAARIAEVRKLYPEAASEEDWKATISHYGLTESRVEQHLGEEIQLMRLVEAHLRPLIQIDARAVESYYQEQLLPELRKSGSKEVPLPEVSARIKDLLAEQKMNDLITGWLASLRSESRISTSDEGEQNP